MSTARGRCVRRAPANRWTAAVVLAHGPPDACRESRSQLRVSAGLAPASPAPAPGSARVRDRADHPGFARPLSSVHPRGMRSATATTRPWHSVAWLVWAVAGAVSVQLAPSPVYVALVIGIAWLIVEVHAPDGPFRRAFPVLLAVGVVVRAHPGRAHGAHRAQRHRRALHAARVHDAPAARRVHRRRHRRGRASCSSRSPRASRSSACMAVFGAFNAIASHYELVQSSPRAFHELGVVTTVALAFVPSTIESVGAVREADRARTGGRSVQARPAPPQLVVPVLERGLERAVCALGVDGRARVRLRAAARETDQAAGWCGLGALLALAGAFVALVGRARPAAIGLGIVGRRCCSSRPRCSRPAARATGAGTATAG